MRGGVKRIGVEDESVERVGETLSFFGAVNQRKEIHNFIIKA